MKVAVIALLAIVASAVLAAVLLALLVTYCPWCLGWMVALAIVWLLTANIPRCKKV